METDALVTETALRTANETPQREEVSHMRSHKIVAIGIVFFASIFAACGGDDTAPENGGRIAEEQDFVASDSTGVGTFLSHWIGLYNSESWGEMWALSACGDVMPDVFTEWRDHLRGHRGNEGDYRILDVSDVIDAGSEASASVRFAIERPVPGLTGDISEYGILVYLERSGAEWKMFGAKPECDEYIPAQNAIP